MNHEELIGRYLRLKAKLSMSYRTWHSGRIEHLTDALQAVERELRALQLTPPAVA